MSKVEEIIDGINANDDMEIHSYDFDECFTLMREMEHAMTEFVNRVDKGEVKSVKTYQKFKRILDL